MKDLKGRPCYLTIGLFCLDELFDDEVAAVERPAETSVIFSDFPYDAV